MSESWNPEDMLHEGAARSGQSPGAAVPHLQRQARAETKRADDADVLESVAEGVAGALDVLAQRLAAMQYHARALQRHASKLLGTEIQKADAPDVLENLFSALEEVQLAHEALVARQRESGMQRVALERDRDRYLELFECAPDAYMVTDVDGTIREANGAAGELLGVAPSLLPGKPLIPYLDGTAARDAHALLRAVMEAGDGELSFAVRRRGGATVDVRARVTAARDRDGRCISLGWLVRDVTDRVRAEREIAQRNEELARHVADRTTQLEIQSAELDTANRAKSDFLAVMSHELRTPLQAILGFADLMRTDMPASIPEYARRWADHIHGAAEHLVTLVEQILRLSQLEAGRESAQLDAVDISSLVETLVQFIEPAVGLKGLALSVRMPPEIGTVITDAGKLRQIVFNLLGNAVKFTDRGEITLEVQRTSDRVIFEVRDTGIGIAPQHLERVFDQFWQAECRPTTAKGGTGLGLSIARQLAHLLSGDLTVRSTPGAGSVFRLEIPAVA